MLVKYIKYIPHFLSGLAIILSGWALNSTGAVKLGALPVYQVFQVVSPNGMGAVMSSGVATSTLSASTTPTFKGITATSTIQLTNAASGCAQFSSTGGLTSTGVACAASQTGKIIDYYASNFGPAASGLASTTGAASGNSIHFVATCSVDTSSARNLQLDVSMTGKGTTTLDKKSLGQINFTTPVAFTGVYTASTTANLYFAVNNSDGTGIAASCSNWAYSYIRFTN